MRSDAIRLILASALVAAATAAAAQQPPPPSAQPTPPSSSERVKTSDELKRESVEGAATAPLRDLNVVRAKIPPILLEALSDPYARPPRKVTTCPQLIELVRPLDEALGPDIDVSPAGEDEDLMDRSRQTALGAAADLASDAIPFRGWVRKLSGAEKHDRLVQSAIIAGNVRRSYLKGLGEARGCNPPATPSHERAGSPPVVAGRKPFKPKYPIRPPPGAQQTTPGSAQLGPPKPPS